MATPSPETVKTGGVDLAIEKGGSGRPLLILHDELGYPGWMIWNDRLAEQRTLLIPLQPGFGKTAKLDWIGSYRDLAGFYSRFLREQRLAPIDAIGFSAGGFIAAEMAAADPTIFKRLILVAPMGIKPERGEILDFLSMTIRSHLRATVADTVNTVEFGKIYGGEMSPEQFEAFEDARTETARLGWDPFMHNPSLPYLLEGLTIPTLLIRGAKDAVVPQACIEAYEAVLANARCADIEGVGHRPEIENSPEFVRLVKNFLRD